jgi:pimeloyl-ACP methyl ester carboxylesterase
VIAARPEAANHPTYGPELEGFDYPYEVQHYKFMSQRHSMGGMMTMRYALMFPDAMEQIVLVNPIGLEDWQAEGVPFIDIDEGVAVERATTFESIKQYQRQFYYAGQWKPEYDRWVEMAAGLWTGPGADVVTNVQGARRRNDIPQPRGARIRAHQDTGTSHDWTIGSHGGRR